MQNENKAYPFFRLVLPNFILTVLFYMLFLPGSTVEILIWLILGCLIPLIIIAILCAKARLLRHKSSIRSLLKIIFCINVPFLGIAIYILYGHWSNPLVWLFVSGLFILGCAKDFLLTLIFLPKQTYQQIIQKRYPVLLLLIVSILMLFITPAPDYPRRTYVAEGMALAAGAKMASDEFYVTYERFPYDNAEVGLVKSTEIRGQSVKSVEIKPNGIIKITYNDKLKDNSVLTIKAMVEQDKIYWKCIKNEESELSLLPKELPAHCRNQIYRNIDRIR